MVGWVSMIQARYHIQTSDPRQERRGIRERSCVNYLLKKTIKLIGKRNITKYRLRVQEEEEFKPIAAHTEVWLGWFRLSPKLCHHQGVPAAAA